MSYLADVAARALARSQTQRKAAEEAAMAALVDAGRGHLTRVLGAEAEAEHLQVIGVNAPSALVIFTDGATDLAVRAAGSQDAQVWLVRDDEGWTGLAQLHSLVDLAVAQAAEKAKTASAPGAAGPGALVRRAGHDDDTEEA